MTTTVLAYIPSPAQGVWQLGPLPIRAYALFIITGIIAALLIGDRRWIARGGEPGVIYDVVLWAVPFGLVGGRLYHVMTDWRKYFGEDGAGFIGALRIWDGGLGIWGAVALGGIGAWIACRRRGIPLPAFGDAIAPGIILAQAIGRLGNYFNQELYGRETTVPWGLEIYERRNAAGALDNLNGVSTGQLQAIVHPTFLYELLWNLLVFAALIYIDRRWRIGHGRLFAMYVAGYCLGRFWIELMRSDEAQLLAGIRINSFTATFVFIGAVVYIMAAPKGREAPETLRGAAAGEPAVEEAVKQVAVASGAGVVAAAKAVETESPPPPAEAGTAEPEPESGPEPAVVGDEAGEPAEQDPDAELAAQLEQAAEAMAAEAAVRLGAPQPEELAAGAQQAPDVRGSVAEAAEESEAAKPARRIPPFDAEADAELAEQLELAADAMAGHWEGTTPVEAPEAGDTESEPEAGLGSVDGGEVAAAAEDAPVVHDEAVAGEVEAGELAEQVEGESGSAAGEDAEAGESEPEAGLGSVDGGEVAAAAEDAPVVHDEAVAGEVEAGELAEQVAEEPDRTAGDDSDAKNEQTSRDTEKHSPKDDSEPGGRVRQWLRRRRNR
ncbi:prolipoprotein diacylglyceryl transferase [Micromonospora sp. WMMD737]|uniref:prolipoprotein diacylglyceryl transferase n=1 Tax=Micromonospora sp. WMMD737 TaxID=3404113 RepID=UPI003B94A1D5